MRLPPELYNHLHNILKNLKSQGPQDPAVFYILKATREKMTHDKMLDFSDKYTIDKKGELSDGT